MRSFLFSSRGRTLRIGLLEGLQSGLRVVLLEEAEADSGQQRVFVLVSALKCMKGLVVVVLLICFLLLLGKELCV